MNKPLKPSRPVVYSLFYEVMRQIANDHGYALCLHGSMQRDMDVVAIPWIPEPKPYIDMIKAFGKAIGYVYDDIYIEANMSDKPLGRKAINLNIGGENWIDLSIIQLAALSTNGRLSD
jgi:hypothetical protein